MVLACLENQTTTIEFLEREFRIDFNKLLK